ncbi:MAG TPA: hypothetical protein VJJ98_08905 [Sedimentisphaerales bacterium]|nr:hypothetical protein [Sedimentisphaerales bacterium]
MERRKKVAEVERFCGRKVAVRGGLGRLWEAVKRLAGLEFSFCEMRTKEEARR